MTKILMFDKFEDSPNPPTHPVTGDDLQSISLLLQNLVVSPVL